jgi:hypothetical protein
MTKRKPNAVRGRPSQDRHDQIVIDLAAAFRAAWQLGAQQSRDFAIALLEGTEVGPSRQPRARLPVGWNLTGFEIATKFENREKYLRRKGKALPPRAEIVRALTATLQSKDETKSLRVLVHLLLKQK